MSMMMMIYHMNMLRTAGMVSMMIKTLVRNAPIQEISVEIFGARGPGWERDGGMRQSELDRRRVRREEESAPAAARCQCKCSSSAAAPVHQRWRNLIIGAGFHSVLDPLTCNDK